MLLSCVCMTHLPVAAVQFPPLEKIMFVFSSSHLGDQRQVHKEDMVASLLCVPEKNNL